MNKKEDKKRIAKLRQVINHNNYLYHVLDTPEINDAAFDSLKHELSKLEEQYPDLITLDSPTQRVSGQALDKFKKVKHKKRMLSLEDIFYQEELEAWQERIQKLVPSQKLDYFTELKIDGFAITLIYKNGIFFQGATRGDSRIGEDVTQNLKTIKSIPLKLEIRQSFPNKEIDKKAREFLEKGEIEVRGEVYMTKSAFKKVNEDRMKNKLPLYANPRNTAAGSIRQLDSKIAASRKLDFLSYDLVTDLGQETHEQEHQILRALGFKTSKEKGLDSIKRIVEFKEEINKIRNRLAYQIDGLVISVNNNVILKKLGVVGKAPRGMIAYKFPAEETTTIVKDIVVQVGRTGALTPVAILKPIRLGGVSITRATLHNDDEIKRLDVKIGDTVIIQRAGDVIPDIVKVIKKLRTNNEKKFNMPKKCPACGSKIIRKKGEVVYRCTNLECGSIQRKRIMHFVSRKAFNIDGIGPQIVNQLMDEGLISDPSDLFLLKYGDLVSLERFAEKSANNLIESIEKSKEIPLDKFIYSLGIRHVGEETSIALAQNFGDLKKISKTEEEKLANIEDIGQIVAQSIVKWFNYRRNRDLINNLIKNGVKIGRVKIFEKKLSGLIFVLTGELDSYTREKSKTKIRQFGGEISNSVSKNTDFVVYGNNPGSKYMEAKRLGVKIINEKEFLKIIKKLE